MAIDKNTVAKEAQKFVAKGQFDKAIAEWKKLLKENPNDPNIYNTIGDLCLKKESKPEAVDAYKKAADLLAADGFSSKAIALYKKVLNIDPKKIEVHLALGDLNAEKGLTGNALESYKLVADHYTQNKKIGEALGIYQKMADLNPSNVAFRLKLADMYVKQGMKPEAVKTFLEAADAHIAKGVFQEARQIFEKLLTLDPGNKQVYYKAGVVYFKEGKFVEACKAFRPAFDADPSNQELLDLYIEALSKADRSVEAEEIFKKILSQDAGRNDLRERLYRIYLAKKDYGKALAEAGFIADSSIGQKEPEAAERILKDFAAAAPTYAAGRRKLGELYASLGRAEDAVQEFVEASEIFFADRDLDGARAVLGRALEIAPDKAGVRQRLESLEAPKAAPPPPPAPEVPVAATEPEAPEPAPPVIEVPPPPAAKAEPPVVEAPPPPPPFRAAAPAVEEDPAIAEAFTEVDVLVKYGLTTKAVEQLETMALKFPDSPQIRIKLRDFYGDQGNMNKAAVHMLALADLYLKQGRRDEAEQVLHAALEVDPGNRDLLARLGKTVAPAEAPPAATPVFEAPAFEESAPPPLELPSSGIISDLDMAPPAPPSHEEQPASPPDTGGEIMFEGFDTALEEAGPAPAARAEEAPFAGPVRETPLETYQPQEPTPPAAPTQEPLVGQIDLSEIWAEAEFFFQQGLFDEARKHYEKILEHSPNDQRALVRIDEIAREKEETREFSRLAEAVEDLEGLVTTEPSEEESAMGASVSDDEAVRMLMQEIQKLKQTPLPSPKVVSPPPPRAPEPRGVQTAGVSNQPAPVGGSADENFFDLGEELRDDDEARASKAGKGDSDDFFDLAAELRDDLSGMSVPGSVETPAEDQSLDDIFEDFKKGVKLQEVKQDLDTHYNLGIAYKELGLLDDAIAEFVVTPEGESKFIESRAMLGLCYMEQGEFQKAIAELRNALNYSESLGGEHEERIGMRYDLGLAYQGAGSTREALIEFQKVAADDPLYRDVAEKLQELEQGGFISLEQLKDDIEKEISSKFLEEGERIGREEKNRKNEKVKS